jgi:hypothetical protein
MPSKPKSWAQKAAEATKHAGVQTLEKPFAGQPVGARMLISTPHRIAEYVAAIPGGQTVSVAQMRHDLAQAAGADFTCPLTTGIFLRLAIEADLEAGGSLPFWRVVEPKSPLAKKLSCGPDFVASQRTSEEV